MTSLSKNESANQFKILNAKLCIPESAKILGIFLSLLRIRKVYLSKEILKAVIEYRMMGVQLRSKTEKKLHNGFQAFMKSHFKSNL